MTVLIAGAGIGGLTLALSLHSIGIKCRIFESVEKLLPLGVGINLQPHAIKELEALGLLEQLDDIAPRAKEVVYFSTHGKHIWDEPRGKYAGYNWPQFSIHRGRLQMLLYEEVVKRLGEDAVELSSRVVDWKQGQSCVQVTLQNPKQPASTRHEEGSLLIGADGIHSAVRARYYPDEGPPRWGGIMMWRGVTYGDPFLSGRSVVMAGCKQRKFVCYPIGEENGKTIINWIADLARPPVYAWNRESWNRAGRLEDFLPEFEKWQFDWLDIPSVIKNAEAVYEFPMVDRDPLVKWSFKRVTLLGDAAHPMYPIGSNGASQAILDCRVLAREIGEKGQTAEALKSYEDVRLEPTGKVVLANRGDGPDKALDIVEARAPNGFDKLENVLNHDELKAIASSYKKLAGFDIDDLNSSPPLLQADV